MALSFETVRKIALSFDNVEEGTSYGTPAFRVNKQLFLRLHQDGESLVVRMDANQRDDFIGHDPDTYYITDHYRGYDWLLVRLSRVKPDALRDVIAIAYTSKTPEKKKRTTTAKSSGRAKK